MFAKGAWKNCKTWIPVRKPGSLPTFTVEASKHLKDSFLISDIWMVIYVHFDTKHVSKRWRHSSVSALPISSTFNDNFIYWLPIWHLFPKVLIGECWQKRGWYTILYNNLKSLRSGSTACGRYLMQPMSIFIYFIIKLMDYQSVLLQRSII